MPPPTVTSEQERHGRNQPRAGASITGQGDVMEKDLMGQLVTVTKRYERAYHGSHRTWEVVEHSPMQGWIVGFRTIWDGYMDCDLGEYGEKMGGDYFVHTNHHSCALVSMSPRQNPVRVPPDGYNATAPRDS